MQESVNLFEVSEFELHYSADYQNSDRPIVTDPDMAEKVFRKNWRKGTLGFQESFYVMFLDNAKQVMGLAEISKGGFNATVVDPRVVFAYAIKAVASSIILAHNHPSGNLKPSTADRHLTKRLKEAGELLGIKVDDHLILTSQSYVSVMNSGFTACPF